MVAPPTFQLYVYRVAESLTGKNVHQHGSGKFYYDQQGGIALTGKVQDENYRKSIDRGSYSPSPKDNDYLPQQPDFKELAQGGILEDPIKVLKKSDFEMEDKL